MHEIDVTSIENSQKHDILQLIPEELLRLVKALPVSILEQNEVTLATLVRPTEQKHLIRVQFWNLVEKNKARGTRFTMQELSSGISTPEFLSKCCRDKHFLAWLLIPRVSYDVRVEALLDQGYERLREVLELPFTDEKGQSNTKAIGQVIAVVKMLDMRRHGGYVQKIEEKSYQIHAKAGDNTLVPGAGSMTLDELDMKIKELESNLGIRQLSTTTTIEIESEAVDE